MFLSTIIPTIGRPSLTRAVESVLGQGFTSAEHEVVVVNDSGQPLPEANWQRDARMRIISTNRRERSVARNTGAAIARGVYLHFLDDDDWLLPGALESFWELARGSDAVFLYGNPVCVNRWGKRLVELRHEMEGNCFAQLMAGECVLMGSFLVDAETFFAVGGFNPLMPGSEEMDLYRKVALRGDFARTSAAVVSVGVGEEMSSTDYGRLSEHSRKSREAILDEPGVFTRMRGSAHNGYWRGRVVRAYLTSVVWNLEHKRLFTAASRAVFGLRSMALAWRDVLSADFWRAVTREHKSFAFSRGSWEAGVPHR